MIGRIEVCETCGLRDDEVNGDLLGVGKFCLQCGGTDGYWLLICKDCESPNLFDEYGEYIEPDCFKCGASTAESKITDFSSWYVFEYVLKRPDLQGNEGGWIPAFFVEALVKGFANGEKG